MIRLRHEIDSSYTDLHNSQNQTYFSPYNTRTQLYSYSNITQAQTVCIPSILRLSNTRIHT